MLEVNDTLINLEIYNPSLADTLALRKIQSLVMQNQRKFHMERIAEKLERESMTKE